MLAWKTVARNVRNGSVVYLHGTQLRPYRPGMRKPPAGVFREAESCVYCNPMGERVYHYLPPRVVVSGQTLVTTKA